MSLSPTKRRTDLLGFTALCVAAFYFVHRSWCVPQLIRGDTFQNLYFLLNKELVQADHNPFQWHYASYMPFIGSWNPVLQTLDFLARGWSALEPLTRVFVTAWLASAVLLSAVSASFFLFFRRMGFDCLAAMAGAIVASYAGFQLVGVYEFNHMYLLSYLCVPWVTACVWRARQPAQRIRYSARAGLGVGVSLLGGSNAPLFYFLPVIGLLPFLSLEPQKWRSRAAWFGWTGAAFSTGVLLAGGVLVPGVLFLAETNRASVGFFSGISSLSLKEKFYTLFFRDWWRMGGPHLHEADFYLGFAAVCLAGLGAWHFIRNRKQKDPHSVWFVFFGVLFLWGFLVSHLAFLPQPMQSIFSRFYEMLSIRHPNRFFTVLVFPVAFLVTVGFSHLSLRRSAAAVGLCGAGFLLLAARLLSFQFDRFLPFTQRTFFVLSVVGFLFAVFLILASRKGVLALCARVASLVCLYLTLAWAPSQATHYSPDYVGDTEPLSGLLQGDWSQFMGLKSSYGQNLSALREKLIEAPAPLRPLVGRPGGILDDADFGPGRRHYHAPQTKLVFPFASLTDPASPRSYSELAALKSEAIWDMSGLCWRLHGDVVTERPDCFSKAFFVGRAHTAASGSEALKWLGQANTASLRREAVIECQVGNCPEKLSAAFAAPRKVELVESNPGRIKFRIFEGQPGFVVLTAPYRMDWIAEGDTGPKKVFKANHAFMAVSVGERGETVTLHLDSLADRIGGWITWTTAVWLLALSFLRLPQFLSQPTLVAEPN